MDDSDRDLEVAVEELADTLAELRSELREPPTGPLGLPRPPTPREFLRFTERYTIPALISLLETTIRVLELVSASIRLVDDRPVDAERGAATRDVALDRPDRIASLGRTTLEALDEALAELQSAAASAEPGGPELERLLADARELGAEVDARLSEATTGRDDVETHTIEIEDAGDDAGDGVDRGAAGDSSDGPEVDVDAELESIKDELDGREQPGEAHGDTEEPLDDADDAPGTDGGGGDADRAGDDGTR